MTYVAHIIGRFGGVRAMARALNRPVATVGGWHLRGSIPDRNKPEVLAVARSLGLGIEKVDFFPSGETGAEGDQIALPAGAADQLVEGGEVALHRGCPAVVGVGADTAPVAAVVTGIKVSQIGNAGGRE